MGRAGKRRTTKRGRPLRRPVPGIAEPRDPLDDVLESGGELFLAVAYTPGGAPFGPRVEIVDGELVFPDELPVDAGAAGGAEGDGRAAWDRSPPDRDSPF